MLRLLYVKLSLKPARNPVFLEVMPEQLKEAFVQAKTLTDCPASISKEEAIYILDGKNGFVAVSQTRHDYVAFLWFDKVDSSDSILLEVFCERYPGMSLCPCRALIYIQSMGPSI